MPPNSMKLFAGSAYLIATREFIEWVVQNETVRDIINWTQDTYSPDEMIWASLSRFPGAPGYRNLEPRWDLNELQTITRIVKWNTFAAKSPPVYPSCRGYYKRSICVYGLGDMHWVRVPIRNSVFRIQFCFSVPNFIH